MQLFVKLNSEALDPERATEEMCKGAFPELPTVKICGALDVPCVVLGKAGVAGEKVIAGAAVPPVPLRATVCGESGASSAIVKLAERKPGAAGVKVTTMEQLELTAIGDVHVGLEEL